MLVSSDFQELPKLPGKEKPIIRRGCIICGIGSDLVKTLYLTPCQS